MFIVNKICSLIYLSSMVVSSKIKIEQKEAKLMKIKTLPFMAMPASFKFYQNSFLNISKQQLKQYLCQSFCIRIGSKSLACINYKSVLISMNNPIKTTVQLSKQEKLKLINAKLNNMMKQKNVDQKKLEQSIGAKEIKPQQKKEQVTAKEKGKSNEGQEGESDNDQKGTQKLSKKQQKLKKQEAKEGRIMRKAAGQVWQDKTMEDWPENDYRIFCGNLGNEVNDEILASVFRRYPSFQMARVVRDRRTGKARGYGFVSLTNPNDFLNALKEMNGKHVGNRPVKLMKSNWKDRDLNSANNQYLPSDFKKNSQKQTHKICLDYKYVSPM